MAIRRGLGFTGDIEIPYIRLVESPKDTIEQLRRKSEKSGEPILEVLQAIVQHVDPLPDLMMITSVIHRL